MYVRSIDVACMVVDGVEETVTIDGSDHIESMRDEAREAIKEREVEVNGGDESESGRFEVMDEEAWVVTDTNNYGDIDMEGKTLAEVAAIEKAIESVNRDSNMDDELICELIEDMGAEQFENEFGGCMRYEGSYSSDEEFAEETFTSYEDVPKQLEGYINWQKMWDQMYSYSVTVHEASNGKRYYFQAY